MTKQENPIPQGRYVPAVRFGGIVCTAGMTPRQNGVLIQTGKVEAAAPLETYREAVRQAAKNALTAAENMAAEGERVVQLLSVSLFINAAEGFSAFSALADFASEYFCEQLGAAGLGGRAAVGVAGLPGNAPVELQLTAVIR